MSLNPMIVPPVPRSSGIQMVKPIAQGTSLARKLACLIASPLVTLAAACSPPAPAETPPASPPPTASAPRPRTSPLQAALQEIQRPSAVLSELPDDIRTRLKETADKLSTEQQTAVLQDAQIPKLRPLLYLTVGGASLDAYGAVIGSTAVSDELIQLRFPNREVADLVSVSNRIVLSSAKHILRERAVDLSPDRPRHADVLRQVAQAASTLRRSDIERLALEELVKLEDRPEHRAALAVVLAEGGDAEAAKAELALATKTEADKEIYRWAMQAVGAAGIVAKETNSTRDGALRLARAYLELGQESKALEVLGPHAALAPRDLALATTRATAALGGSTCPHVLRGTTVLCRAAWKAVRSEPSLAQLQAAFDSGQGRDRPAIEAYLGLSFVVPMMYRLNADGSDADAQSHAESLDKLRARAESAIPEFDFLKGVSLLAESLAAAFRAGVKEGPERPQIEAAQRKALLEKASTLLKVHSSDSWIQAGALGTLALLAQDEPIGETLDLLLPVVNLEHQVPLGSLSLWTALTDGDQNRFQNLKGLLASVAKRTAGTGIRGSRWLVLWGESEAQLLPGERSYKNLKAMSEQLVGPQIPLGLRLRSALNLAGLNARQGNVDQAIKALESVVTGTPRGGVGTRDEQELLVAATGYLLILRGVGSTGAERKEYADKLTGLLTELNEQGAAPPSIQMWLALWRGELERLMRSESCKGNQACEKRAARASGISKDKLNAALGQRTAQLLRNGAVPIGGVELEFRYDNRGTLLPHLVVDPRFPLIQVPPLK